VVLFVAKFFFHEHGLPKLRFCKTSVAGLDRLALGGESVKLNNLTEPGTISSSAQGGASRGSPRMRSQR
jgi:hypothetical protein